MLKRSIAPVAKLLLPLVAGGLLSLTGCPGETPQGGMSGKTVQAGKSAHDADDHDHGHHHHHHNEKGPHGGALVAIGEEAAHLEFVLDGETGKLTAYVLDGDAEKAVAVKQASLQLALTLEKHGDAKDEDKKDDLPESTLPLTLTAVSPADDGTATEFAGQSDKLKGADEFEAALSAITVGGKEYKAVTFKYPEGNEHDHHHH
jgi:hypothetical protein